VHRRSFAPVRMALAGEINLDLLPLDFDLADEE
jgi:hypothetical protein